MGLALVVHALLIAALTWGVNWKHDDPTATFECALDNELGPYLSCVSPHEVTVTTDGAHVLFVRAIHPLGTVAGDPADQLAAAGPRQELPAQLSPPKLARLSLLGRRAGGLRRSWLGPGRVLDASQLDFGAGEDFLLAHIHDLVRGGAVAAAGPSPR